MSTQDVPFLLKSTPGNSGIDIANRLRQSALGIENRGGPSAAYVMLLGDPILITNSEKQDSMTNNMKA